MTNVSDITAEVVTKLRRDMHQPTKDELRAQLSQSASKQIRLSIDADHWRTIAAHLQTELDSATYMAHLYSRLALVGWSAAVLLTGWLVAIYAQS